MRKLIDYMMTHPLFTGIAGIMVAIFSIKCCNTAGDSLSEGILRMLLVGTMAFFLYFVSREKTLQKCGVETGYVVKVLSPLLITSALLGGLSTVSGFISHVPMQPNWIANFFLTLFEMLFVGLFEEIAFRALINDAIVYRFRVQNVQACLSAKRCTVITYLRICPCNVRSDKQSAYGRSGGRQDDQHRPIRACQPFPVLEDAKYMGVRTPSRPVRFSDLASRRPVCTAAGSTYFLRCRGADRNPCNSCLRDQYPG